MGITEQRGEEQRKKSQVKYFCKAQEKYNGNLNQNNDSLDEKNGFGYREICPSLRRPSPCIGQLRLMQSNKQSRNHSVHGNKGSFVVQLCSAQESQGFCGSATCPLHLGHTGLVEEGKEEQSHTRGPEPSMQNQHFLFFFSPKQAT